MKIIIFIFKNFNKLNQLTDFFRFLNVQKQKLSLFYLSLQNNFFVTNVVFRLRNNLQKS